MSALNKADIQFAVKLFINDLSDYGDDPIYQNMARMVMRDFIEYVEEM